MSVQSNSTSQMVLDMSAVDLHTINTIEIRYLVIQSTFVYLTTAHLVYSTSPPHQLHSGSPFSSSETLPKSMDMTSRVLSFFNGWRMA